MTELKGYTKMQGILHLKNRKTDLKDCENTCTDFFSNVKTNREKMKNISDIKRRHDLQADFYQRIGSGNKFMKRIIFQF